MVRLEHPTDCPNLRACDTAELRHEILVFRDQLFDGSFQGSLERIEFVTRFHLDARFTKVQDLLDALHEKVQDEHAMVLSDGLATLDALVQAYTEAQSTEPVFDARKAPLRWHPTCASSLRIIPRFTKPSWLYTI